MQRSINLRTEFVTTGLAAVAATVVIVAPLSPVTAAPALPTVAHEVRLAASSVPPGGLITSFLHNQTVYCSIICPLLAQTGVTAVTTTLQAPGTFLAALSAGDLLKAIGAAAASVTGPTDAAAQKAIDADAAIPAQRALNAFEVGVVGLLNVLPAVQGGLPGIAAALQKARQDTYDALNLPFVPNPTPTVMPRGVFQVAVVGAINVVAAVIFPAFNDVLAGAFQVPDAIAQELAKTGNPVRALAAGIRTAAGVVVAAGKVVAQAVVKAVDDVRGAAAMQPLTTKPLTAKTVAAEAPTPKALTAVPPKKTTAPVTAPKVTTSVDANTPDGASNGPTAKHAPSNPVRDAASNLRHAVHNLVKNVTPRPPAANTDKKTTTHDGTGSHHG